MFQGEQRPFSRTRTHRQKGRNSLSKSGYSRNIDRIRIWSYNGYEPFYYEAPFLMIRNYIKTAFRIMLRQKGYSAINISGLSIGIAATMMIIIYIVDELGYDKMHNDAKQIYRAGFTGRLQGNLIETAQTPAPVAEAMLKEIPQVTEAVRFGLWRTMPVSFGDKNFTENHMLVADSNFFEFFSFRVVKGDANSFLKGPNKLVITESAAKRYFGAEDPIGKIMLRGAERSASEITGVVKDPPHNSHIVFDMVLSGESWDFMKNTQWTSTNLYTYFKIRPGTDPHVIQKHLHRMAETNMGAELERYIGMTLEQFRAQGNDVGFFIQPMLDIRLRSNISDEITPNGNIQYLYIFAIIALFIILVACINFMNLSTARSANRAKEVGVRKTIGAVRSRLVFQFISESLMYAALSTLLAVAIIGLSIDGFNQLAGKQLNMSILSTPLVIGTLILFTLTIGLIAGSYPAFYLTSFKPTEVLKGRIRSGYKNSAFRNVLVVFQFMISIALIFGSLVVYSQLNYMQEKNLGFNKENVVSLLHTMSLKTNAQPFKNEINGHPDFQGASFANTLPPKITWTSAFRKGGSDQDFILHIYEVDHDQLKTMGYEMAEGRFFSRDFKSDSATIILNETAFKQMGFANIDEATVLPYRGENPTPLKVIGVLKDFNYESLRDEVRPMAILLGREPNFEIAVRLSAGNSQEKISTLEAIWKKYAPDAPFEYSFIDQNFDSLFRAEQRMSRIILIFTILAIAIACLGLFGLAAYTAEQRSKEISIRKVLGASISQVMVLLSRDFTMLVMVAFVIASPLAWFFAEQWLSGFANRIHIDFSFVVISGFISLFIALITISYQSIKAAKENPVDSMRLE
jgi:putative ABC transport system permease protein